jgi:hypothetical protein
MGASSPPVPSETSVSERRYAPRCVPCESQTFITTTGASNCNRCPGANLVCSGHGLCPDGTAGSCCSDGLTGNGLCTCVDGYSGRDCSTPAPCSAGAIAVINAILMCCIPQGVSQAPTKMKKGSAIFVHPANIAQRAPIVIHVKLALTTPKKGWQRVPSALWGTSQVLQD